MHRNSRVPCRYGDRCTNVNCTFEHGTRPVCRYGSECSRPDCTFDHPHRKQEAVNSALCRYGASCTNKSCSYQHPDRAESVAARVNRSTSKTRNKFCLYGNMCTNVHCQYRHRDSSCDGSSDINGGEEYINDDRQRITSPDPKLCKWGIGCKNDHCTFVHPERRKFVGAVRDEKAKKANASYYVLGNARNFMNEHKQNTYLNTMRNEGNGLVQVQEKQTTNSLPVQEIHKQFTKRLKKEQIIFVTGATESGKAIHLPQYAASAMHGLIVCTQARALSIKQIAEKIALEFDKRSVGLNVGYRVNGQIVEGKRIMLMTDAELVLMAQCDKQLKSVSVLIISDAHERSLNTDIVIAISKKLCKERTKDFKVVVCSAPMDMTCFSDFFYGPGSQCNTLTIPNRTYPVAVVTKSVDESTKVHAIVVDEVVTILKKYKTGNCLVFMPSTQDVNKVVACIRNVVIPNVVVLSLTEELSDKDLNKVIMFGNENSTLRLVFVATDVAETYVTVPDVQIVIDTGLVKKACYDVERHITLVDEVYISQANANWRKDLAGRTPFGHCLRLYKWEDLPQKDVLPDILRSCLNLALLQLFNLDYNPFNLEFLNRPNENIMRSTINLLISLHCLDSDLKITRRGQLFSTVNMDPCISNFVLMALESYGQGVIASEIAAIIDARPKSILFYEPKTTERKQDVANMVEFPSDLLYLHSLYKNWMKSGVHQSDMNSGYLCKQHGIKMNREIVRIDGGCQECRVQYAKHLSLNNRVLNLIRNNACRIQKILFDNTPQSTSEQISLEVMDRIIGRCLARSFSGLVGEFLMPSNPMLGIHLISANLKGKIAPLSVTTIPRPNSRFVIPLLVTKLWTGQFILDLASHVEFDWLASDIQRKVKKNSLDMVQCYQKTNISQRYLVKSFKYFEKRLTEGDRNSQFVVCLYDSPSATLTVYAPKSCAAEITPICDMNVKTWLQEDIECEDIKECFEGLIQMTVTAGMTIKDVNVVGESVELRFVDPPVENDKELLKWVCGMADLKSSDIKWCKYYSSSKDARNRITPYGTVVFRNKESALAVKKIKCGSEAVERKSPGVCRVLIESSTETSIENILKLNQVFPLKVVTKIPLSIKREITLKSLPVSITESLLEGFIKNNDIPMPSSIRSSLQRDALTHDFILNYRDSDECSEALEKFRVVHRVPDRRSAKSRLAIRFASEYNSLFENVGINCVQNTTVTPAQFIVILQKPADGDRCYQIGKSQKLKVVDGSACLLVEHHKTYDLNSHAGAVAASFGVKFKWGNETKTTKEVIFHRGLPSKCVQAVKMLRSIILPIKHNFGDCEKQAMGRELHRSDQFQTWAETLGVVVDEHTIQERLFGIKVYGEKQKQGLFMRKIADYYTSFSERYSLVKLHPSAYAVFNQGNLGELLLSKIKKVGETHDSTVIYNRNLSVIEIIVNPSSQQKSALILKECKDAIKELLKPFHLETTQAPQSCVYCHETYGSPFFICGHNFCKECLELAIQTTVCVMSVSALRRDDIGELEKKLQSATHCPSCNTKISVKDIVCSLKNTTLTEFLNAFAYVGIRKTNLPIVLCPNLNCSRPLPMASGYASCASCNKFVCPVCGIVDDDRHKEISCKEYQLVLEGETSVAELVKKAEAFARDHWKTHCSNQPGIVQVEVNPGLKNGCRALQLYCKGFEKLGLKDLDSNTIFGWHGTTNNAIPAICNDGFDPSLRRGQAYGIGEYFGTLAQISMGYAAKTQRLIVVQIIKAQGCFSEKTGFCYVVNNPIDRSYTLCLPVIVVSYGTGALPRIAWIDTEIRPIPYPFGGATITPGNDVKKGTKDSKWVTPFRWHWMTDKREFEPYSDSVNTVLEKYYESFKHANGPSVVDTDPIIRYVDDVPQVYNINFQTNTQTNVRTRYVRRIERKAVAIPKSQSVWKYLNENGVWMSYESLVQGKIESAYQDFISGLGSSSVNVQFPGRPESYKIDFVAGKQTNLTSKTMHDVIRE